MAKDLLMGEVWLASGQSNMVIALKDCTNADVDIKVANDPQTRYFDVPVINSATPVETLTGEWKPLTPDNAGAWSCVAFYFARSLAEHLHVPIGIIHSALGSTAAEAWTPLPSLLADPRFAATAKQQNDDLGSVASAGPNFLRDIAAWETKYNVTPPAPIAEIPADLAGQQWKPATLPMAGARLPITGAGTIWVRRSFTIEDPPPGGVKLTIGPALDMNTAFINGKKLGDTPYTMENAKQFNKSYIIPKGTLVKGTNTIYIRAFTHNAKGTRVVLAGRGINIDLNRAAKKDGKLDLAGEGWESFVAYDKPLSPDAAKALPAPLEVVPKQSSSSLYNGMIYPLHDFAFRGAIWYQGENNAPRAADYPQLMSDLILGWRKQFHNDFPFYIVQLPVFTRTDYPGMRAAQAAIPALVPKTAIAVTIDTGSLETIHPKDKKIVGGRLALLALHRDYGEKIEDSGPFFASATPDGASLVIHLTHAEGLHEGKAPHFSVAGPDGKFADATAKVAGETLVLTSPSVSKPVAAKYAQTGDAVGCDVYNSAGLPLAPFDTTATSKK